ncbi:MAG: hypothetical protein Q7O66_07940 [Dehalococcoidia bacterium]|nr:hypothetical protein [Dehalococcoidia bacterium]
MANRVGEVIESGTTEFIAQCYELHEAPPFGSLVRVGDGSLAVYGLVYNVTTASLDPGRRPIARGKDEEDEAAVFRNNPQLAKLFRTDFTCLVAGYGIAGQVHHFLPPAPPRVHAFVYECTVEEVAAFTMSLDFLSSLLSSGFSGPGDELAAAFLRLAGKARIDDNGFLVRAGKELAVLLSGDLRRLNAILRRMRP